MTRRWSAPRVALALWVVWAVAVWNVVFDHTIEVAGRAYLHAAALADQAGGSYARVEDWLGAAQTRAFWMASAAAAAILAVGLAGCRIAVRGREPRAGDRRQR